MSEVGKRVQVRREPFAPHSDANEEMASDSDCTTPTPATPATPASPASSESPESPESLSGSRKRDSGTWHAESSARASLSA